jgi:hypothetical protein
MVQFYFLSVLFTILTGLVLVYGKDLASYGIDVQGNNDDLSLNDDSESLEKNIGGFEGLNNSTFRLALGILSVFVAIMKLLTPCGTAVVGDFLPVLAGLSGGAALLVEYFVTTSDSVSLPETVKTIFIGYRRYIGIASFAVGVLHFILPRVILL